MEGIPLRTRAVVRRASDERLVALARAGAPMAFEAIYQRYRRPLLAYCRQILGSPEDSEDAVQHTFLSAYRALLGDADPANLRGWLYVIAHNRCVSMLRGRREKPTAETPELPAPAVADLVQHSQDVRAVLDDMATLPDSQRAALVLAELDALSHREIARVLGGSQSRVTSLVYRARESLLASRHAREADCREMRDQLATLEDGSAPRGLLRRHLSMCDGCRDFDAKAGRRRRGLALALPILPAIEQGALQGAAVSGVSGGLALGAKGVVAKVAVGAVISAGVAGGAVVATSHHAGHRAGRPAVAAAAAPTPDARVPAARVDAPVQRAAVRVTPIRTIAPMADARRPEPRTPAVQPAATSMPAPAPDTTSPRKPNGGADQAQPGPRERTDHPAPPPGKGGHELRQTGRDERPAEPPRHGPAQTTHRGPGGRRPAPATDGPPAKSPRRGPERRRPAPATAAPPAEAAPKPAENRRGHDAEGAGSGG
jgi:RNA polymerase sigma factor (sigma-70 family)